MLRHVLGIGWDVGGWIGRRQGVAIVEWNDHSPRWLGKQTCFSIGELGEHWGVDDLVCFAWPEARSGILEDRELVLAIDAPLGFPVAFSELLAGRFAPSFDTKPEIGNRLAYRETDRHVYRTLGKKPLSASFDKLGNNATVAMVHTRRLSNTGQLRVVPFDKPQKPIPTAIEVYPALSKKPKKRGDKSAAECLPALRGLLPPEARDGTDECDACLCALLALAYGHDGRTRSLPRLQGPTETTAEIKQEGWIFYPAPNWATTRTEQSVRKT